MISADDFQCDTCGQHINGCKCIFTKDHPFPVLTDEDWARAHKQMEAFGKAAAKRESEIIMQLLKVVK